MYDERAPPELRFLTKKMICFGVWLLCILIPPATRAAVENRTRPGELVIDPPTLINLGFEWIIEGDDNRSAKAEVSYRKQGDAQWKPGLPLLRLQGEQIYQGQGVFDVVSPNMFAGSILDLEPDTLYETRFILSDPEGVVGRDGKTFTKILSVRTRGEPETYAGGKI